MTAPRHQGEALAQKIPDILEYRAHAGFNAASWGTLPVKMMCIECEVVELENAMRIWDRVSQCPDNVAFEVADIAMYAMLTVHDLRGQPALRDCSQLTCERLGPPEVLCAPIRRYNAMGMERWRRHDKKDAVISIELIVLECQRLAKAFDIYLPAYIERKLERNYKRPHLHGGKHPDS